MSAAVVGASVGVAALITEAPSTVRLSMVALVSVKVPFPSVIPDVLDGAMRSSVPPATLSGPRSSAGSEPVVNADAGTITVAAASDPAPPLYESVA